MDPLEYYAYLAAKLPAGDLARAAVRKIAQRATRAFQRRPLPETEEVLKVFCANDPFDLALKLASPRASSLWADASQRDAVREVVGRAPEAKTRILMRARSAYQRQIDVFGTPICFGRAAGGVDWHCDFLNGGRFPPLADAFGPEILRKGLDPKVPWTVARLAQGVALGQGVWLCDSDEECASWAGEFVAMVRHFVQRNPPGLGVNWGSPMEVALRATNLCLAFLMMRHRPELQDPRFALDLARTLIAHGRFVEAHLEHACAVPNNHLVANLVGLLHLGMVFPEITEAKLWRDRAIEGLKLEIERQVLDDGFSFEGSTSYHRLSTELFTLALLAAQAARIDLGKPFRARLHAMYRAVRTYLSPSGLAPQIGDNDSGRALPLSDRPPLDHRYLLPLGAALFADPDLKPEGVGACEEVLFLLGPEGASQLAILPQCGPLNSTSLPSAGLFFLRSRDLYCAVCCGSNGQAGVGGHSHNDKLGIEIHAAGQPLIVDTGTFCYTSDPDSRNAFRSTAAHSTVQVDREEQNRIPEGRLFALPDHARARALGFEWSPARDRFLGEHRGYDRLSPPVRHRREVVLERSSRAVLVIDSLSGQGTHSLVARYHLPHRHARIRHASAAEKARFEQLVSGDRLKTERIVELGPEAAPQGLLATPERASLNLSPAWYSPGYGQRNESICVEIALFAELPTELMVAILL